MRILRGFDENLKKMIRYDFKEYSKKIRREFQDNCKRTCED